jgi:hypothetical protein
MLKDYEAPTATVSIGPNNTLIVRGISFDDLSLLMRQFLADLTKLLELYETSERNSQDAFALFIVKAVTEAPAFSAAVIAIAAGEPDQVNTVRLVPFPAQVECLRKIGELTFADGGLKNLLAMLRQLRNAKDPAGGVASQDSRIGKTTGPKIVRS